MHASISSLLLLCCISTFTSVSAQTFPESLTTWEQIHQTLHTYSLAIDSKTPSLFSQVFTRDAFANYTGTLSDLKGLRNISTALIASVDHLLSQHQLGTTVIDIHSNAAGGAAAQEHTDSEAKGQGQRETANSTTYFTASLFGDGTKYPTSKHVFLYGQYRDELVKAAMGWRIFKRQLVFMGPFVGDQGLLGG